MSCCFHWFIIAVYLITVQCSHDFPCNVSSGNHFIVLEETYNISLNEEFCIISNANISITTNSSGAPANIICTSNSSNSSANGGIAFFNSSVVIDKVNFIDCGAYLNKMPDNVTEIFNRSYLYYPTSFAAALMFLNSTIRISEVSMQSSFGFAVIGFNIYNSSFIKSNFSSGTAFRIGILSNQSIGSGLLLHFANYPTKDNSNWKRDVMINNCYFENNFMYNSHVCNHDYSTGQTAPIQNSAGLTILYTQTAYHVHVSVNEVHFERNVASLLIIHYEKSHNSTTHIQNCMFKKEFTFYNYYCPVTAEMWFIYKPTQTRYTRPPLLISDTSFIDETNRNKLIRTNIQNRLLHISIVNNTRPITIELKRVQFLKGNSNATGVCMYVENKFRTKVKIYLESIVAMNNTLITLSPVPSSSGIFTFTGVTLIINGTLNHPSNFSYNFGNVIDGTNTSLKLHGHVLFRRNLAINGPAINLKQSSRLFFMTHSSISFQENKASNLGGAIYAVVSKKYDHCAFYFASTRPVDNNITFINNSAREGGDSIYASPIFNCKLNKSHIVHTCINSKPLLCIYKLLLNFTAASSNLLQLSTTPISLTHDGNKEVEVYPGEKSSVCLFARDDANRIVFSSMSVYISPMINDFESNNVWLSLKNKLQSIEEKNNCTNISISLHSLQDCVKKRTLFFFLTDQEKIYEKVNVNIHQCPIGFSLKSNRGVCDCSNVLENFSNSKNVRINCSINTQTFYRPSITSYSYSWAGYIPNNTFHLSTNNSLGIFAISSNCLAGHCTTNRSLKYFYSSATGISLKASSQIDKDWPLCTNGREGLLCGKCKEGYYLEVSNSRCIKNCPSYISYWVVIVVFIISGPFCVLLLFGLKMTLSTGTIGGIIFYANVVSINLKYLLFSKSSNDHVQSTFKLISINFLSFIELGTGVPVCFYKEMDELQKTTMGLAFPLYLLMIVAAVTFISRYSVWLSNKTSRSSVQVLVTVVHLSFTNLCRSLVKMLSSTELHTDEKVIKVWLFDGSIEFLKNPHHLIIVVISLTTVLPLITSYVMFLLLMKYFLKCSSKLNLNFRQIYEAIHAPYKEGKEYWFVTRLLLLVFISILPLIITSHNEIVFLITAILMFLFLIGQVLFHPYKHKALNVLDNWIMLNLAAIYVGALIWTDKPENAILVLVLSSMSMLCTFIGIIVYHILIATGLLDKIRVVLSSRWRRRSEMLLVPMSGSNSNDGRRQRVSATDSFYGSCNQFREPILGDNY